VTRGFTICLAGIVAVLAVPVRAGSVRFNLSRPATTSAGVFDTHSGELIRTVWSGRRRPAGSTTIDWDGFDDDGRPAPSGLYVARLLTHNVRYVWEGVIGNTSKHLSGPDVHRAFQPINDMAFDGDGHGFYVVGYNEQQSAIHRFEVSEPQVQLSLAHDDYLRVFRFVAADDTLAYFANVGRGTLAGAAGTDPTFVIALRIADGTQYRFAAGHLEFPAAHSGNRWESVIDEGREGADDGSTEFAPASGLAVQRRGESLFIAHESLNEVRVLDKRTGNPLASLAVERPTGLGIAPDDSLWVLCRSQGAPALVHFLLQGTGWSVERQVTGAWQNPVALGVSPIDGTLVVADAGTEQLRAFNSRGELLWTYGRRGGYQDGDPAVTSDRLWLSAGPTYVAFQRDGSFWVGDPGNARNLHLSARRSYVEQIMFMPATYHAAVNPKDPTRIFNRFLEFAVDYRKPLPRSWSLVRNWAAGLARAYFGNLDGLRTVVTLSNGRTYAVLPRYDDRTTEVIELQPSGVRPTGVRIEAGWQLYPDGSLRGYSLRMREFVILTRKLSGFDSDANPRWGTPLQLARVSNLEARDPYYHDVPIVGGVNEASFPKTSKGVVVSFNPSRTPGFHLGGIRIGGSRWLWRASPSGRWTVDKSGRLESRDGTFELDRGVQYAGNRVIALGDQIVYGYHGEGWNGGQADQWMHYLDDGLFVGQFGEPVYPAHNKLSADPGAAGNAFSPQLVLANGELYLWHNDESVHGGVHRWHIEGVDQIRILEAPIAR
jgi:hypothetical protein